MNERIMFASPCIEFLLNLYENKSRFSNHYYDCSGKYGSQFLGDINSLWLGDVRGCSQIDASKYCVLDLVASHSAGGKENAQHNVKWGLCVPRSCSEHDLKVNSGKIFKGFFSEYPWMTTEKRDEVNVSCMELMSASNDYYVVLTFTLLLVLWCVVSTAVVARYNVFSKMRYSFVHSAGPKSFGVVDPPSGQRRFRPKRLKRFVEAAPGPPRDVVQGTETSVGGERESPVEGCSSSREGVEGRRRVDGRGARVEEEKPKGVGRCDNSRACDDDDDDEEEEVHRMDKSSACSSQNVDQQGEICCAVDGRGGGTTAGGDDDDEGNTFRPPSPELLRRAFQYRPGFWTKICSAFCLKSNLSKIVEVQPNRLIGLDCMLVLSCCILLFAQVYMFSLTFGLIAPSSLKMERIKKYVVTYIISCYPLALDTVFFISGFLFIHKNVTRWHTNRVSISSIIYFYVRRYLRLFLPLAFLLLATIYLVPYWTSYSGPSSFVFEKMADRCSDEWWKVVIGLQNFLQWTGNKPPDYHCLQWTWFVANQWQFSILSPLILIIAIRKALFIFSTIIVLIILALTAFMIGHFDLKPFVMDHIADEHTQENMHHYMAYMWTKPYTWVVPYTLGCMLSYKLQQDKLSNNPNFVFRTPLNSGRIRKRYLCCGWLFSAGTLALFFGLTYASLAGFEFHKAGNVLFGTFMHLLWSAVLSWVVFACYHGSGGVVGWFGSWEGWHHLGRLTYSAYLVHGLVLMCVCSRWTSALRPDDFFSVFIIFISTLVLSYVTSLVPHLLLEAPLLNSPTPLSAD